ncbi:putative lipoprotein releasing system transmembrane protein [Pedobacter sp. BAL39]|uniref:ABC transporter permease n=1 Tax=Pedobacter sp. BAL39 TaxID=391596 RepID=UPI000155AF83|nr:ABC transporter permease [Pedobacter sp. BAL39]EDM34127.1 putative lipoprotein releasing system transmembrane protein [Pedobacter sp. BAL39]
MNTAFYIARRYLFAKKSTNAINIISTISVLGVFVGSAALIIILSVFNGFEEVVLKMFNTMTPQVVIMPEKGKTFEPGTEYFQQLKLDKSIYSYVEVLSENALLRYNDKQSVGLVKGVGPEYLKNKSLDSTIIDGHFLLGAADADYAVIGSAIQNFLMVNTTDPFNPLQIYSPKKGARPSNINPGDDFTMLSIPVSGVFEVQQDFDNVAIVPLAFARRLLDEPTKISAIEINLNKGVDADQFKDKLEQTIPKGFEVKDRIQQNKVLHNILGSEKWAVYIILTFILIIAIFNIIGSLTMLVIDKLKDIAILSSLGAGKKLIKRIFLFEGMMITMAGCIAGLTVGFIFCLLQREYGMVKMSEDNLMITNAYPIALKYKDFLLVFFTVTVFSFMASALSSNLSVKKVDQLNKDL